jgi:hypothetical protein
MAGKTDIAATAINQMVAGSAVYSTEGSQVSDGVFNGSLGKATCHAEAYKPSDRARKKTPNPHLV